MNSVFLSQQNRDLEIFQCRRNVGQARFIDAAFTTTNVIAKRSTATNLKRATYTAMFIQNLKPRYINNVYWIK